MNTTYKSNNNIVYSCKYHVVWCPKYRRKVLTNGVDVRLKELLTEYAANLSVDILEMEIMPDHVHMLLVRENQTIYIEDLNVKGMLRNHKLARSIASVSWTKFFKMLEYKAVWYGNEICRVPTMYPSSQICSCCGYQNPLVKDLRIRIWECPKCHVVHDRDMNAGINILKKGLQMQYA